MKTLVTGATGFAGSWLCEALLRAGHHVVGLDCQTNARAETLARKGVELHIGSVADETLMQRLCCGCQRVFHLAAAFRKVNLPAKEYWQTNVEGTRILLDAARAAGVEKTLYCSTCGVHGHVDGLEVDETAPIAPADWYQETKWEGEKLCQAYHEKGLWVSIVRPAAIFGPGDPQRFVMLYKRAAKGRFMMVGDGSSHYHPCYIEHLIDAMLRAIERPEARGKAYLIADRKSISKKDLVVAIGRSLGTEVSINQVPYWPVFAVAWMCQQIWRPLPWEPPLFPRRIDWFIQNRSFSIRAAQRDLGFDPCIPLKESLRLTGEWYQQQGLISVDSARKRRALKRMRPRKRLWGSHAP